MRTGLVKIGTTGNFSQRFQTLNSKHRRKNNKEHSLLRILATIEGDREREEELHQQFQSDCVEGEYFNMSDDLCCFISSVKPDRKLRDASGNFWKSGHKISQI